MCKKLISSLIFGIAIALVVVTGNVSTAKADCGCCLPCISLPSPCLTCAPRTDRDYDNMSFEDNRDRVNFDKSSSHSGGSVGYGRGNINDFSHDF